MKADKEITTPKRARNDPEYVHFILEITIRSMRSTRSNRSLIEAISLSAPRTFTSNPLQATSHQ